MGQQLLFKLDQNPNGRGLRCDAEGLFLGRDALLQRDSEGNFEPRSADELRKVLHRAYGDDANWESHARSVKLVAAALNKGDLARATASILTNRATSADDGQRREAKAPGQTHTIAIRASN
jgi:hypothetical protein